jgi:hypothetical protein
VRQSDQFDSEETLREPLDPGLDYYDATPTIEKTLELVRAQAERIKTLENCILPLQQSMIRAHRKLIELEADMAAAGIGSAKAEPKSALIMPSTTIKRPLN